MEGRLHSLVYHTYKLSQRIVAQRIYSSSTKSTEQLLVISDDPCDKDSKINKDDFVYDSYLNSPYLLDIEERYNLSKQISLRSTGIDDLEIDNSVLTVETVMHKPSEIANIESRRALRLHSPENLDVTIQGNQKNTPTLPENADVEKKKLALKHILPVKVESSNASITAFVEQTPMAPPTGGHGYFKRVIRLHNEVDQKSRSVGMDNIKSTHELYGNIEISPSASDRNNSGELNAGPQPTDKVTECNVTSLDILKKSFQQELPMDRGSKGVLTAFVKHDKILNTIKTDSDIIKMVKERLPFRRVKPAIPEKSFNLASYVQEADILQQLVSVGVDLSKIEKSAKASEHLLKSNWKTAVQPFLDVLQNMGITVTDFAIIIGKYPDFLLEDIDNLHVRLHYLESKKFSRETIGSIVTKCPRILGYTTEELDAKLGFWQKEFKLKGDEVRTLLTVTPKIVLFDNLFIHTNRIALRDMIGFSDTEIKKILLKKPRVLCTGQSRIMERYDYLNCTMKISNKTIVSWPQVFCTRLFILKQRHEFLESIKRAQYDPNKENFVSLKALVSGNNEEFCVKVAKVPVELFNDFSKTL